MSGSSLYPGFIIERSAVVLNTNGKSTCGTCTVECQPNSEQYCTPKQCKVEWNWKLKKKLEQKQQTKMGISSHQRCSVDSGGS